MAKPEADQFVRLWVRHQNDLLRTIAPLVGSMDDAQDVLQETALALWKKRDAYEQSQPFLPWARQFAKYEVLMYHRRRQRYTFLSEPLIEALAERQNASETISESRRRMLMGCVDALRHSDRLLLRRRYDDPNTTIQEVAQSTGQTANALYKTLQRIRRQLLLCINRRLASPTG